MTSRFHESALRMLARSYVPDVAALGALKRREGELGIALPASFVEWFGMRSGVELLRAHSNRDHPMEIEELGSPLRWRWLETTDCLREGLLPFMVENQAVCLWAVSLDGSEDPPVMVARNPELVWRACAKSFSTFIECQVWDHTAIFASEETARMLAQAQDVPLRGEDLALLRDRFVERTMTYGWPADRQYRFESRRAALLLWSDPDRTDWWISSGKDDHLADVTRELWQCGNLRSSLWSHQERGEKVLDRVRFDPG